MCVCVCVCKTVPEVPEPFFDYSATDNSETAAVLSDIQFLVVVSPLVSGRKEGRSVLFNDALNTFYLRLYGVRHMVKDHSDSERGNPLWPHGLLFLISSKGSFICIIPQTG